MKQNLIFLLSFFPIFLFSQRRSECRSAMDFIFSPDYFAPPQEEADAGFTPLFAYRVGLNVSVFSHDCGLVTYLSKHLKPNPEIYLSEALSVDA